MSIDRLTALDQMMLGASRIWPQDIGALVILDGAPLLEGAGRFKIDAVRDAIDRRLHLAPRFRQLIQVPRRGLGGPLWVDAPTFDLARHVQERPLEPPGGEADLLASVARLLGQRLDPSRPLWEMWFLTGLPERRVALFVRLHHAIADGMAAMATLGALLEADPAAPAASPQPWTPRPWPSTRKLLADDVRRHITGLASAFAMLARPRATVQRLLAAWPATRELLAEEPGPKTSLDRTVGPDRSIALIRAALDEVRESARTRDATVNDLLLTVTAGGLRALLRSRGEPVEDVTLPIYVPVSLRRRLRGPQQGNVIGQMVVHLPLGVSDPFERLTRISAETTARKARSRPSLGTLFRSRVARRLLLKAVIRLRVNVTSACIPGPTRPLYLAGARVLEVFPVLPLIANEGLGVGALSYAGTFAIGVTADRDAYPDIEVLAAGVRDELRALGLSMARMPRRPAADARSVRDGRPAAAPGDHMRSSPEPLAVSGRR